MIMTTTTMLLFEFVTMTVSIFGFLAMAVALGNLYRDELKLMTGDIASVLVAAHALLYRKLEDR